jgi:hypothetical protein
MDCQWHIQSPTRSTSVCESDMVNFRAVAGCVVTDSLVSYADGYNAITIAAANRKFGHDVFLECRKVDRKYWEAAYKISKK